MKAKALKITVFTCSVFLFSSLQAKTFYVKSDAASGGNGSSWTKAYKNLDLALIAAKNSNGSDQIWIAKGIYRPAMPYGGSYTGAETNLVTFNLPNDVAIYGGFNGNETSLSQRNYNNNVTILSGDISNNDINDPSHTQSNKADNAWHVLTADGVKGVILDGLTVTGGFANGPDSGTTSGPPQRTLVSINYAHSAGGGLIATHEAQVTLKNMRFIYNGSDATNSTVRNPALGDPSLVSGGGAIKTVDEGTHITISSSTFDRNTAFNFGGNGGAISTVLESSVAISGSIFTNNSADRNGGAVHGKDGELIKISSSIFDKNKITGANIGDESGGGIGTINTNLSVSSSVFKNNIGGASAGGGGIFFHVPFDDGDAYELMVNASTFTNNQGAFVGGGAINIFGFLPNASTKAAISACVFNGNKAINGGAIYVDSIPTVISSSSFNGNQADFSGGAIFASSFGDAIFASGLIPLADRKLLEISSSQFSKNTVKGPSSTAPSSAFMFNIFASALGAVFGHPGSGVDMMTQGGGAIASTLGGRVHIASSSFVSNTAPLGQGGALLIGGSAGTPDAMAQSYVKISKSSCKSNSASQGINKAVVDVENLGNNPDGVQYVTDGSCQ